MRVSVPAGSTATVYVPADATQDFVATSGQATAVGREDGYQVFSVNPGDVTFQQGTSSGGTIGGTVPPTLALTLGATPSFGAFAPGVARTYTTSTTATVTSTAGDATLSAGDPGHLVNGAFSLTEPLQVSFSKSSWDGPTSNEAVTVNFQQEIGANEPLRTGNYAKTLTYTLSTTTP